LLKRKQQKQVTALKNKQGEEESTKEESKTSVVEKTECNPNKDQSILPDIGDLDCGDKLLYCAESNESSLGGFVVCAEKSLIQR
jgi:hypothetical protein